MDSSSFDSVLGRDIVLTAGDEGGRAVFSIAMRWECGGKGGSRSAFIFGFSFALVAFDSSIVSGVKWGGSSRSVFVGRSAFSSALSSLGDPGSIDTGGRGGRGFKAPGEVRYVISCKHLS